MPDTPFEPTYFKIVDAYQTLAANRLGIDPGILDAALRGDQNASASIADKVIGVHVRETKAQYSPLPR